MYIISALKQDIRLRPGIQYVESVLQAYQRDSRLNPSIQFPLELQFDEIGVVLDEHSDDYVVGEKSSITRPAFNADAINGLAYKATGEAKIHALRNRPLHAKPYSSYDNRNRNKQEYGNNKGTKDATKSCKACLSAGHCITHGDICYPLAKATLCQNFLSNKDNEEVIKQNIRDYRKERKEKLYKAKTSSKMRGMIHKMYDTGTKEEHLYPIMHVAQALEDDYDTDDYDSDGSMSQQE